MSNGDEITLTLHGLAEFNRDVDAEVFSRKFRSFMLGLAQADKAANGKRRHKFLISDLRKNTATASVREQITHDVAQADSSFDFFENGLEAIYNDSPAARQLPRAFVRTIAEQAKDAGDSFERAEIKRRKTGKVILIDRFLRERVDRVLQDINRHTIGALPFYRGTAYGSFDGKLLLLDSLDEESSQRAILVLTAGSKQIECLTTRVEDEQLRKAYKRRCVVTGIAHYGGISGLPERIDVVKVDIIEPGDSLSKWQGAFKIVPEDDDDWNEA